MTRRTAAGVGWGVAVASLGFYVTSLVLGLTREPVRAVGEAETAAPDAAFVTAFVVFAVAGALIVSRKPRNTIGWLFVGLGFVQSLNGFVFEYTVRAVFIAPGSLPLGPEADWLGGWLWISTIVFLIFLLLLFPDGRLPSLFSKVVAWTAVAASGLAIAGMVLVWPHRGQLSLTRGDPPGIGGDIAEIAFAVLLPLGAVAIVAVVIRFIRSRGEQRLQLKWFALAAGLVGIDLVVSELDLISGTALQVVDLVAILSIPVAVAIAVLKYRLYDIDLIINRALVYGSLAAFVTAVYVGIAVGIGSAIGGGREPNLGLSITATAVVAVLFQPVRARVQRFANRLVYGKRGSPYELLARFSDRVAGSYSAEDVLPRMARVIAEGTGARVAGVWLRVGDELHPSAAWPPEEDLGEPVALDETDARVPGAERTFPVREGAHVIGALTVRKAAGDPLRPEEAGLVEDLAAQAGLVLRNVRLTAELGRRLEELTRLAGELRESRRRIVAVGDAERRRLERNIHDGAQQHLVALAVRVKLAETVARKDPAKARPLLDDLLRDTETTLSSLRDLARGIYPPLLEAEGLATAVAEEARRSPVPIEVEGRGLERLPAEVEAAAYFCILEALQNVAKYSKASGATVRLRTEDATLAFEVADDGRGFDPARVPRGAGLTNMADRLAALGGTVAIDSAPGRGTTVIGRVPLAVEARV